MQGDVSAVHMVALIVMAVLAVGGVLLLPRFWRGELASMYEHASRDVWLWGEPLRRGFIRGLHLGVLGSVVMVFLGFAAAALEPTESIGPVVGAALVLFFALLVLGGSVALFNRPRWVVPPHARNEPGAVHEWRVRRRERRDDHHHG